MRSHGGFPRRSFLKRCGTGLAAALLPHPLLTAQQTTDALLKAAEKPGRDLKADVVIVGGGLGGCAAALAAARNSLRVVMTEETDWIGGQLTAQAVPPDENPWIESFGGTRSYLELRQRVREYYRRNYPLTGKARAMPYLNPGNGWVSRLCHEPRVALAAVYELLSPYISGGKITIFLRHKAVKAFFEGDLVQAVQVRSHESGNKVVLRAPWFVDATELGDVLPLAKAEYVLGAEAQKETGEPHAAAQPNPNNQQAFTCCFAMDYIAGEDHTIDEPVEYRFWRKFVPKLIPPWPGPLLSWTYSEPVTLKPKLVETDPEQVKGLWAYRRIADKSQFEPGTYARDISLVNWPQNDYLLGTLCDVNTEEAARNLARAKQLSLSLLYWMQTEAPRPDGKAGWPGLRLRPDVVGTEDGLAKYPYIRESRRIKAEFTILEQHVSTDFRIKETGLARDQVQALAYKDSVGIGSYRIDLHPSTGGDNYIDISSLPFQIPLGALVHRRMENLLPACKNLGTTHITNGCYRLHPVEWNIGEAVGALAAFCTSGKHKPREVLRKPQLLEQFQNLLTSDGVPLAWPKVSPR